MHDAPQLTRTLTDIAADLPGSTLLHATDHLSLMVDDGVFAYTIGNDVALKLPAERIQQLLQNESASSLVMDDQVVEGWVLVSHEDPQAFHGDFALFQEALVFVAG